MKDFVIRLAKEAGKTLEEFGSSRVIEERRNVTDDLLAEEKIISQIRQRFPNHSILSEEAGEISGSGYTWIIDSLDGTVNHWYGIPHFCVSIALTKEKVILGVIYDPIRRELFYGELGKGVYLNDKKIRVSKRSLEKAVVTTDLKHLSKINKVAKHAKIRALGSRALDLYYIAAERVDACIAKPRLVDIAASSLIVREVGGRVTDFENNEWRNGNLLATNGLIHKQLLELI